MEIARLAARVQELERERDELIGAVARMEHELNGVQARMSEQLAIASHEILTPLVMAEAHVTDLYERARHQLDLDARHELDGLARMFARVRVLVEALLMDARSSNSPLRRERVDLESVLRGCLATLAPEISARGATVDVGPLPVVSGNAALLSSVFGNLLVNALKYGPDRRNEITVTARTEPAHWRFTVDSSGSAIPAGERDAIFEPWRRGPGRTDVRGSGLGLTIVRRIVERHGGQVGVTAPNDSTNRFFLTLPT